MENVDPLHLQAWIQKIESMIDRKEYDDARTEIYRVTAVILAYRDRANYLRALVDFLQD